MTKIDLVELFQKAVAEHGQAAVSRAIGYSASAVNQALHGKYQGDLTNMLTRIEEVYGGNSVDCPILGRILQAKCAEHRRRPFAATNPQRVALYRACQSCKSRGGIK